MLFIFKNMFECAVHYCIEAWKCLFSFPEDTKLCRLMVKDVERWRAKFRPSKSFQIMPRLFEDILRQSGFPNPEYQLWPCRGLYTSLVGLTKGAYIQ